MLKRIGVLAAAMCIAAGAALADMAPVKMQTPPEAIETQAEGELVRLLSEEGARGNAVRTLADALNSNRAERNDTSVRNSQLKELYLAKALAVCAPENPLGNGILKEYAESMQGYYVLFADGKLA